MPEKAPSLQKAQMEFTHDAVKLLAYIMGMGWGVSLGECWRPEEMQRLYVQQGKSKTMNSYHRKRLAIDLNCYTPEGILTFKKEDIQKFGDFWEGLNPKNSWGGNWKSFLDTPHFERRFP